MRDVMNGEPYDTIKETKEILDVLLQNKEEETLKFNLEELSK